MVKLKEEKPYFPFRIEERCGTWYYREKHMGKTVHFFVQDVIRSEDRNKDRKNAVRKAENKTENKTENKNSVLRRMDILMYQFYAVPNSYSLPYSLPYFLSYFLSYSLPF